MAVLAGFFKGFGPKTLSIAKMKNSDVPGQAIRRAIQLCGGIDALSDALNVQTESLHKWLDGEEEVPMPVFIQTVGLLLEVTARRPPGSPFSDPSDGGRKGNRH
jgi:hypothetical protein